MAKKGSDSVALGIVIVIGAVIAAVGAAIEWARNNLLIVGLILLGISLIVVLSIHSSRQSRQRRYMSLVQRFGSEEIATDIVNRTFWTGQTAEQLLESLGSPISVDKQLLKTKTKEVWKYHEVKKNQFALKITLENDRVIGWDKKGS